MSHIPLTVDELSTELAAVTARGHYIAQAPDLPFGFQSARQFELLTYALLKEDAAAAGWYDEVQILAEGADAGADVRMVARGRLVGVAQCKRYKGRIDLPTVLAEIFKFLLFAAAQDRLPEEGFQYQFWTACDVARTTADFVSDPGRVLDALTDDDLQAIIEKVQKTAAKLKTPSDARERESVRTAAKRLHIRHLGPAGITRLAAKFPTVRRQFFRGPDDAVGELSTNHVDAQLSSRRRQQLQAHVLSGRAGDTPFARSQKLTDAFSGFLGDDAGVFVLSGGSGRGKSTWTARLMENPPPGYVVDMIAGDELHAGDDNLVTSLSRVLSRQADAASTQEATQKAVWNWINSANRIVVIDGLDRVPANARDGLSGWLDRTISEARVRSVRLVLTTRPETWIAVRGQLEPASLSAIFMLDGEVAGAIEPYTSYRLALLDEEESREIYGVYGLAFDQHRQRPLRTPALIRIFADLKVRTSEYEITRNTIFHALIQKVCADVDRRGIGAASAEEFLDRVGELLTQSKDGRLERTAVIRACEDGSRILDGFLQTDLLVRHEAAIRPEPDEAAEYLGARMLDVDTALVDLSSRIDESLFVGMLAMAMGQLAEREPSRVTEAIEELLAHRGHGRAEACIAMIGELRNQAAFEPLIQTLFARIVGMRIFLAPSMIEELISVIRLRPERVLELLLELAKDEESDDWRPKFWIDTYARGRLVTPFARLATATVRNAPSESIRYLVAQYNVDGKRPEILRGLLIEAGAHQPRLALDVTWPLRHSSFGGVYRDLAYLHPVAAALQVRDMAAAASSLNEDFPEFLWRLAQHHRAELASNLKPNPLLVIAEVSRDLCSLTTSRAHSALLKLAIAEAGPLDAEAQADLAGHWDDISSDEVWSLIAACPMLADELLDRVFLEAGTDGQRGDSLKLFGRISSWDPFIVRLAAASKTASGKALDMIVEAVELALYADDDRAEPDERLRDLARIFAASSVPRHRRLMLYYAGSSALFTDASAEKIAFRDELLASLIAHETGENLDTLVWKISESAKERGNGPERLFPLPALRRRCRRGGSCRRTHRKGRSSCRPQSVACRAWLAGDLRSVQLTGGRLQKVPAFLRSTKLGELTFEQVAMALRPRCLPPKPTPSPHPRSPTRYRLRPPPGSSRCAPCLTGSSAGSSRSWRRGSRTGPAWAN